MLRRTDERCRKICASVVTIAAVEIVKADDALDLTESGMIALLVR